MKRVWTNGLLLGGLALAVIGFTPALTTAQPPSGLCDGFDCDNLYDPICSNGFSIALTDYVPASPSNSGAATYEYEVCVLAAGTCEAGPKIGNACQGHKDCSLNCGGSGKCSGTTIPCTSDNDCKWTCSGECRPDEFHALSHFDVEFPELGADSCLAEGTQITIDCTDGTPTPGDASQCYGSPNPFVAKCDGTTIEEPGECLTMTLTIAGETNSPGLGAAVVADKESTTCTFSCIAGPSCDDCNGEPPPGDPCLTRTLGFWGTHPHLIQSDDERSLDLLPITVCGTALPVTAGPGCSTSEALCSSAHDNKSNPPYLALVAQLTAAKLNLAATAAVTDGSCSDWVSSGGESIGALIARCEGLCGASKKVISESGCIEALDEFNSSEDGSLDVTPPPFDSPGPALPGECQDARGNGISLKNC